MSAPLLFVRDGRTLPFFPVTVLALEAIREWVPKRRPYALATYVSLLELANEQRCERAAVSQKQIAERVGVSRSTVQNALLDLEEAGVLEVCEQTNARGRVENEYIVIEPSYPRVSPDDTPDRDTVDPRPSDGQPVDVVQEEQTQERTPPTDVERVHARWVEVMGKTGKSAELDPESRKLILAALKIRNADECIEAIEGCRASEFHMGANDRRQKYNALSQILKGKRGGRTTGEQIDFFREIRSDYLARRGGSSVTSADDARVRQAKRDVLDAHEFPGDEHVVQRGNEARLWLQQHGWKIEATDDGPRFSREQS